MTDDEFLVDVVVTFRVAADDKAAAAAAVKDMVRRGTQMPSQVEDVTVMGCLDRAEIDAL